MSLRTRLIIAFLLLSVVPLSAVTLFSYISSVRAFESAAQREATESATDVSRRMEMITADVGRRMDRLFVAGTASPQRPFQPDPQAVRESLAPLLGETAALVDRVEFHPAPDVQMAADLERHEALAVQQERLRRELELSRLIQTEMLPRTPLRSGPAEIGGISIPASEVGGDFFNYFVLPDGRLALLVGDVSGKGVSAALLMANIQATLRALLPYETDLAQLADRLDRDLDRNTPGSVYLTLFLGILETDGRLMRYVNAGHNPQFILRANGGIEQLGATGMPIALYSGHGYRDARVQVSPGDLLFFYTDGLVETENERGEMFGAERLQQILSAQQSQGIDAVLHGVEEAVVAFRGKAEPFDDATMMVLRISAERTAGSVHS